MVNDARTLSNPDSSQEEKINAGLNLTANILTGGAYGAGKNLVENVQKEAEKLADKARKEGEKLGENLKKGWERFTSGDWF
jgi:outer membrane protein TolC